MVEAETFLAWKLLYFICPRATLDGNGPFTYKGGNGPALLLNQAQSGESKEIVALP